MKILTNLDLNKNELQNVAIQKLTSAPLDPVTGQMYYNTQSNRAFVYTGATNGWVGMDAIGATMTGVDIVTAINGSQGTINAARLDSSIATTSDIATAISDLVGQAPETLDTLAELASALGSDENFATTVSTALGKKTEKYSAKLDATASQSITHNLNTLDVVVTVRETGSPYEIVYPDVYIETVNKIKIEFAEAPTNEKYTVIVIG